MPLTEGKIEMGKLIRWIFLIISTNLIFLISCDKENVDSKSNIDNRSNIDSEYLKGTWIDSESFGLQFIDFYSKNQARFGMYSKNLEKYDTFNYQIIEPNQLLIKYLDDNNSNGTVHNLTKNGNDTIKISDLAIVPENPNKIYLRRELITDKINDTIILGNNQIYFDFENHFRLQIDSILNDSRCPLGVHCAWSGNAEVKLNLITEGNFQHNFVLNTHIDFRTDTLVGNIHYKLVELVPYPEYNKTIDHKDYKIKILIEKK